MTDLDAAAAFAEQHQLTVEEVADLQQARSLTAADLEQLSDAALRKALFRLQFPDRPRERERYWGDSARGGRVTDPDALLTALDQLDSLRRRAAARPLTAGLPSAATVANEALLPPTAGLNNNHSGWLSIGPGNIGGRVRAIVPSPLDPDVLWAGSAGGGVWQTLDGGVSWNPVDDLMANLAICSMAVDPSNPSIIYAGTGEGFSNMDALRGAGIFRTTDGQTWAQLPATRGREFHYVNRLAISRDGKVLLAATPSGILRSADPGRLTWATTLNTQVADVDFHPTDARKAVAGGLDDGRAYYSTDGGQTWKTATPADAWSGRVELTYAAKDPATVYASVDVNGGEVWRSTDGGRTYVRRTSGSPVGHLARQGWYANAIWAGDPTNADLVVVGGLDLWRSTNGGRTFTQISRWWRSPESAHADHHLITSATGYNGTTNRKVYFGNDGGIYRTDNVKTVGSDPDHVLGWTELDNTFGITQFYGAAGNAATGVIIGGAQDNGTLRYDPAAGAQQWTEMEGGDGGYCAADPTDPDVFYGEYVYLNIHRSTDGGQSAEYISGQFWNGNRWDWKPVPFQILDARNQTALFIAPFVIDPNNANRLLGGGMSLWRTNDAKTPNTNSTGPAWAAVKPPVGRPISAIAIASGNSDLVWVGHTDGQVYRSTNATAPQPAWQRVDHRGTKPLAPASQWVSSITVRPGAPDTVYVTYTGYSKGNIWKSTDGGATWSNLGANLPEAPIRALALHPRKKSFLYAGTEVGVFASEDDGATWSPTNEGPTNCSVSELFWLDSTLVCATHGRGMFTIDLSRP